MKQVETHALVVFSGGQDSTTCLFSAIKTFDKVSAIGFDYGQNHSVEMQQAKLIADQLGIDFKVFNLDVFTQLADSALVTGGEVDAKRKGSNLPASFVPNRNALFLTVAHAYAQKIGARTLVTGVCQTDYSGYPDCRLQFIKNLQETLNEGSDADIRISTPLMYLNKAQTFKLAEKLGCLAIIIQDTHTCYNGNRDPNKWGAGCGKCNACLLRENGYRAFVAGNH